eukprot:g3813.t1
MASSTSKKRKTAGGATPTAQHGGDSGGSIPGTSTPIEYLDSFKRLQKAWPKDMKRLLDPSLPDERRSELWEIMCEGGDVLRQRFAWAIPDERALRIIQHFSPIVEVGSGLGYWAKLLRSRGADVMAYDKVAGAPDDTTSPISKKKKGTKVKESGGANPDGGSEDETPSFWIKVNEGGPEILEEPCNEKRSLFLCYPDDFEGETESLGLRCLFSYEGDVVIHVGELFGDSVSMRPGQSPWGRTTSQECQEELASKFHCILKVPLPSWPHARDTLTIWKRHSLCVIHYDDSSEEEKCEGESDQEGRATRKSDGVDGDKDDGTSSSPDDDREVFASAKSGGRAANGRAGGAVEGDGQDSSADDEGSLEFGSDDDGSMELLPIGVPDVDMYAFVPEAEQMPSATAAPCSMGGYGKGPAGSINVPEMERRNMSLAECEQCALDDFWGMVANQVEQAEATAAMEREDQWSQDVRARIKKEERYKIWEEEDLRKRETRSVVRENLEDAARREYLEASPVVLTLPCFTLLCVSVFYSTPSVDTAMNYSWPTRATLTGQALGEQSSGSMMNDLDVVLTATHSGDDSMYATTRGGGGSNGSDEASLAGSDTAVGRAGGNTSFKKQLLTGGTPPRLSSFERKLAARSKQWSTEEQADAEERAFEEQRRTQELLRNLSNRGSHGAGGQRYSYKVEGRTGIQSHRPPDERGHHDLNGDFRRVRKRQVRSRDWRDCSDSRRDGGQVAELIPEREEQLLTQMFDMLDARNRGEVRLDEVLFYMTENVQGFTWYRAWVVTCHPNDTFDVRFTRPAASPSEDNTSRKGAVATRGEQRPEVETSPRASGSEEDWNSDEEDYTLEAEEEWKATCESVARFIGIPPDLGRAETEVLADAFDAIANIVSPPKAGPTPATNRGAVTSGGSGGEEGKPGRADKDGRGDDDEAPGDFVGAPRIPASDIVRVLRAGAVDEYRRASPALSAACIYREFAEGLWVAGAKKSGSSSEEGEPPVDDHDETNERGRYRQQGDTGGEEIGEDDRGIEGWGVSREEFCRYFEAVTDLVDLNGLSLVPQVQQGLAPPTAVVV